MSSRSSAASLLFFVLSTLTLFGCGTPSPVDVGDETECATGESKCDGLVPSTCDSTGAWVASDACEFGCDAGSCTGVCEPGGRKCDGLVPSTCDSTGAWVASDACEFVCGAGDCSGECVPGSGKCDGLVPLTCDSTGAWVVSPRPTPSGGETQTRGREAAFARTS